MCIICILLLLINKILKNNTMNNEKEVFPLRREISVTTCPACNRQFKPRRLNQKYCSTACRVFRNNQIIKRKYQQGFETSKIAAENSRLKQILDMPLIVQAKEVGDKVQYNGRTFRKAGKADELNNRLKISPRKGGAYLIPNQNLLVYHPKAELHSYKYELE